MGKNKDRKGKSTAVKGNVRSNFRDIRISVGYLGDLIWNKKALLVLENLECLNHMVIHFSFCEVCCNELSRG